MAYYPFEYFCKFMAKIKHKIITIIKKTGPTKISNGPNFLKSPPPPREIPSLRL